MGLKLPEMPFCMGFAAALVALGGNLQAANRAADGRRHRRDAGVALFSAWWMLHMKALTGNPLFPYFNDYWHSPLALNSSYRDMRFIPFHFWRQLLFPFLFSIDWHVADDLGFQDIRVLVAYLAVIPAIADLAAAARKRRPPDGQAGDPPSLRLRRGFSYFVWLRFFAIYRYIILLEMLAPTLIVAAIGLFPWPRRTRYLLWPRSASPSWSPRAAISWNARRWKILISRWRCRPFPIPTRPWC